jgi:acyl dehydratase
MLGIAGKTGPIPTVQVLRVVKPGATIQVWVEPDSEPTREFGTVANTRVVNRPDLSI